MQIVFVHKNYPAQFGHVAQYLHRTHNHDCIFVSEKDLADTSTLRHIRFQGSGGATAATHYASRTFENAVCAAWAVKEALASRPEIQPDLVVGHSGFGTTLFLRELYPDTPIVNYFEFFYRSQNSDSDFRPDFPRREEDGYRSWTRNAMIMLDLDACARGYSPTHWQHSRLPKEYHPKVSVLFDGIDPEVWKPTDPSDRRIGNWTVPNDCKLVTYATRGMESMRGFDMFLNVAHRLGRERSDIVFAIAGQDRIAYGGDERHTGGKTLKQYLFDAYDYDRSRFVFLGLLKPNDLAKLFSLSDLHFYFTVPFILSWSVFNALSCQATILASDTGPVREVIENEKNGLLVDFYDEDGFVDAALEVLDNPTHFNELGQQGRDLILEKYSNDICLPRITELFHKVASKSGS